MERRMDLMKCKLLPKLSTGDWKDFCDRFHFPAKELRRIQAIYQALLPLVDCYAYYSLKQDLPEISLSSLCLWLCDLREWC